MNGDSTEELLYRDDGEDLVLKAISI